MASTGIAHNQPSPTVSRERKSEDTERALSSDEEEPQLPKWNNPRPNIYRVFATYLAFFAAGANDAAYGALIPHLEAYYDLTYTIVSLIFLSPIVGYTVSALVNDKLHMLLGQRGIAIIAPSCHLIAYIIICTHPPFPVLVVAYIFAGLGNGLHEAAWNSFLGGLANSSQLLGLLHGIYGLGGVCGPLIATNMITKAMLPWWYFYYVLVGIAAAELIACASSFWTCTGEAFRAARAKIESSDRAGLKEVLFTRPYARVTWLCAFFLLGYVGAEVAIGGWINTFMIEVRGTDEFTGGMTVTGYWLGLTVGRIVLGFVTPLIGVRLSTIIYIVLSIGCVFIYWFVDQLHVSAVAVAFQGFFLGPLFPSAVIVTTTLLPQHLHVASIGFTAAFGGGGATVMPFAVGGLAQNKGVQSLNPFIVALSAAILLLWMGLPRGNKTI